MELFIAVVLFGIGVAIIVKGGDFFVDAASWIAEVSGIPKFIVGATVVSLATTLPEIIVSTMAAATGRVDMAIGNAIGSVTANTGLILSLSILFLPLVFSRKQFLFKGVLLIATVLSLFLLCLNGELTLLKSLLMLAIFALFIFENIREAKKAEGTRAATRPQRDGRSTAINIAKFCFGTAGIVIGSQLLVENGSKIAAMLGVPENVIALTAVAIGTSLPELVTAITSIVKRETSLSVGNVIGANIIDTALILPICSFITGGSLPVSNQTIWLDLPVCLAIICIAIIPAIIGQRFYKWQGVAAMGAYFCYLGVVCFM